MTKRIDIHYQRLYEQNEELEMEIQIQCEEKELLIEEVKRLKAKITSMRRAGDKSAAFIEELVSAGFLYDENLDEANKVLDRWEQKSR